MVALSPLFGLPIAEDDDERIRFPDEVDSPRTTKLESALYPAFASAATRDAYYATLPGGSLEGMRCFRTDLNRGEVYSGTAWRPDVGTSVVAAADSTRHGFGEWVGTLTTDASGRGQLLDLSLGGLFTGNIGWVGATRSGVNTGIQVSIGSATITAVQLIARDNAGALMVSQSITAVKLAYTGTIAY
jgi:hypothetical protein